MATISHKKNFIASLTTTDGILVTDHNQKAQLLWESFKNRMGISNFSGITYVLSSILTANNLDHLDADFSLEEINSIIRSLPNSHASGPDEFNGMFLKKCWGIVKEDFLRLFRNFSTFNLDLRSINFSNIALIPKKTNPESVDFRPISLLNYSLKCIIKVLSTRLQSVIVGLVHSNQYGFIRGRSI